MLREVFPPELEVAACRRSTRGEGIRQLEGIDTYAYTYEYIHMRVCVCLKTHKYVYIHIYIYTLTYLNIYLMHLTKMRCLATFVTHHPSVCTHVHRPTLPARRHCGRSLLLLICRRCR